MHVIFGIGFGTATLDEAMRNDVYVADREGLPTQIGKTPIRKIHAVEYSDIYFIAVGSRCVEVTGEP